VKRLAESPALRQRLTDCGRRTAMENFDLRRMAGEIEAYLQRL
jgi:glycosyltransferase involved in cell wall biosynthesis